VVFLPAHASPHRDFVTKAWTDRPVADIVRRLGYPQKDPPPAKVASPQVPASKAPASNTPSPKAPSVQPVPVAAVPAPVPAQRPTGGWHTVVQNR
jgi:hypothetical protein